MKTHTMKIYNTLTSKTETLKPIQDGKVSIYSCGPTVYDHIHIGNLSSFTFADTLRRVIASDGMDVEHVMNFTDVDDKTIRKSTAEYPKIDAKLALKTLTEKYSKLFLEDMAAIGNDTGSVTFIKATASIDTIQKLIEYLVAHDYAYLTDDGVYFSIEAYKQSGKIYGQLLEISDSEHSESRIDNDEYDKDSARDFALWKIQKDGEPAWEFSINGKDLTGRPGWHIECSAMSQTGLGQPFDIHTGGIDLIFPHHENEIAQSTAGRKTPFLANLFVHNEHLLIDGRKMSKSLQNFFTLKDITAKDFSPLALRLMFLQAHYRSQMNFTWDGLQAAANRLEGLRAFAVLRFQPQQNGIDIELITIAKNQIDNAMNNDLSTPEALASLSKLANHAETRGVSEEALQDFNEFISWCDDILGLQLMVVPDINSSQKKLLSNRAEERQQKDWAKSDQLRSELEKDFIGVRDAAHGQIWYWLPTNTL